MNRRHFIQLSLASGALAASGCSVIGKQIAVQNLPNEIDVLAPDTTNPSTLNENPLWRLLNRAGYGPRPGDFSKALALGFEGWLEQQLQPEEIDDRAADLIVSGLSLCLLWFWTHSQRKRARGSSRGVRNGNYK